MNNPDIVIKCTYYMKNKSPPCIIKWFDDDRLLSDITLHTYIHTYIHTCVNLQNEPLIAPASHMKVYSQ